MSDRDIIEFLATKCMGWKVIALGVTSGIFDPDPANITGPARVWPRNFNPLENIADAMECQAALPEDKRWDFVNKLRREIDAPLNTIDAVWELINATPRERCLAIVKALGGAV